jgi:hypothetical protein
MMLTEVSSFTIWISVVPITIILLIQWVKYFFDRKTGTNYEPNRIFLVIVVIIAIIWLIIAILLM